jgi:hypothetical protein
MDRFEKHLDNIINKVLNEALEERAMEIVQSINEKVEQKENLVGGQKKLDKNKNNKIDAKDFEMLRMHKKKDMKEYTMGDVEPDHDVEPYGNFDTEKVKIGKVKNSGFKYEKEVGKEFNEEEMSEGRPSKGTTKAYLKYLEDSMGKNDRSKFDDRPSKVVGVYSDIEKQRMEEEDETVEGNEFSGELARARKEGKKTFKVDGKTYPVKEAKDEKWIQDVDMKKGAFTKYCEGKVTCDCVKKALGKKGHPQKMAQMYLNMNPDKCKSLQENKNTSSVQLTENELIDLIERLVNEQYIKMQKDTAKVEKENGSINQDHIEATKKKMKEYLKDGSEGEYEMDPQNFPEGNGEMKEMPKKAYKASDAVEEYIDAFAYPGMTNLVYDEIKPQDEWIEANIKGSSKTGNAVTDKDGNALGNVVPSDLGEKVFKNYKDNVYGAEQMNASYKRYPQPVDQAGESTEDGALKLKKGSAKSEKIFKQLESTENKNQKLIQEQIDRMKNMVQYNHKTQ